MTQPTAAPTVEEAVRALDRIMPLLVSGRVKLVDGRPLTTAESDAIAVVMMAARARGIKR